MPDIQVIKAGKLIDGNGGAPIRDGVVVVEKGRISAVGPASSTQAPPERGR